MGLCRENVTFKFTYNPDPRYRSITVTEVINLERIAETVRTMSPEEIRKALKKLKRGAK
jgi:hypothetical protein